MSIKSLIFFVCFVLLKCCNDQYSEVEKALILPNPLVTLDSEVTLKDSLTNIYYSRINHVASGGLRHTFIVPTDFNYSIWKIVFKGSMRTNFAHSDSYINVVGFTDRDSTIIYKGLPLKYFVTDLNKWCPFKDSMIIQSANWHFPLKKIAVYAFLGNSPMEKFDIDSLSVGYYVKK